MRTLSRTAGRFLLSAIFIYSGYGMINHAERYAKQASAALPMLPEDPMIPKVQGAIMMGAGSTLALVSSRQGRATPAEAAAQVAKLTGGKAPEQGRINSYPNFWLQHCT